MPAITYYKCIRTYIERGFRWLNIFALMLAPVVYSGCQKSATSQVDGRDISFDLAPSGDRIVFVGFGAGHRDLYLLNLRTMKVERLSHTPLYEQKPIFSSDGKYVVYCASENPAKSNAVWHLYAINLNTKKQIQLTKGRGVYAPQFFTHDGKYLVYSQATHSRPYSMGGQIHVQGRVYISRFADLLAGIDKPKELPLHFCTGRPCADGTIVVDSMALTVTPPSALLVELNLSVWLKKRESVPKPTALTRAIEAKFGAEIYDPTWLPDGSALLFIAFAPRSNYEVWFIKRDGTDLRSLSNLNSYIECLRVSPDGEFIFFLKLEGNGRTMKKGLWKVSIKSGRAEQLADYRLFDDPLHWNR